MLNWLVPPRHLLPVTCIMSYWHFLPLPDRETCPTSHVQSADEYQTLIRRFSGRRRGAAPTGLSVSGSPAHFDSVEAQANAKLAVCRRRGGAADSLLAEKSRGRVIAATTAGLAAAVGPKENTADRKLQVLHGSVCVITSCDPHGRRARLICEAPPTDISRYYWTRHRTPLPELATDVLLLQLLQILLGLSVTSSFTLSPGHPSTGSPAPVGVSNDDSQVR